MSESVVGADGCASGWVACNLDQDGSVKFQVFPDVTRLARAHAGARLVLIDIPIGLAADGSRSPDFKAKRILGKYNSRVFLTPPRCAFDCPTYELANARSREISGRGLMKQMWAIMPKIREVDTALCADPGSRAVVRECHPEICFWGLRGSIISENKRTPEGVKARLSVLQRFVPHAEPRVLDTCSSLRNEGCVLDDVIDAMVAAVSAAGVWDDTLRTLPDSPARDELGLPMEMVYRLGA